VDDSATEHIAVLSDTLAGQISIPSDGIMVDATVGHGGHSLLFGRRLGPAGVIIGFDVDDKSLQRAHLKLEGLSCKVVLVRSNFSEVAEEVEKQGIKQVDFVLADLGVCSGQLVDDESGLSFQKNMPLDMRMDKRLKRTAADIVNEEDERSLANLIYEYGEDRFSRRIARFIVRSREHREIRTTGELASIIVKAVGGIGRSRIHPATRSFQALRIAVNHELENLGRFLASVPSLLKVGGKVAVISFHSLEDRIVKQDFRSNVKNGIYRILTKKPLVASREEVFSNRRARSAKLRIAERQ
jgi:16S rRNA (cytosine1402-N4)-methyltransferase